MGKTHPHTPSDPTVWGCVLPQLTQDWRLWPQKSCLRVDPCGLQSPERGYVEVKSDGNGWSVRCVGVGFGVGFLFPLFFLCVSVGGNFFGWVCALVTLTRHLYKFVRGGDNRHGGRLRLRSFRRRRNGRVPGRPTYDRTGGRGRRQHEKNAQHTEVAAIFPGGFPAAVTGREQKRSGRTPPTSDAWMTAIGSAGGKKPPGKIR